MKLNKNKSGIVVFAPRREKNIPYTKLINKEVITGRRNKPAKTKIKAWVPTKKEIQRVPILSKYKYLGTYFDSKLTFQEQLSFIRRKSSSLFVKLYPYLSNATAGGRKDMWRTMICPLFNALLVLLYFEKSESHHQQMLRLWRKTFKEFMMIPKSTSTALIDEMIGIDLIELITLNTQNSAIKWKARCDRTDSQTIKRNESKDYLKGVPKEWCYIL